MSRTVLITGASAGIGAALARTYAAKGWNLILTARREGPLQALADELTAAYGVTATVIPEDLSDPTAPQRLIAAVAARGLTVDGLVNNAGFSRVTGFLDTDLAAHRAMIQVMLTAPVLQSGIELDVPKTRTVKEISQERMVISIDRAERLYLGNDGVNIHDLGKLIKERTGKDKQPSVFLRADRNVPYGTVAMVVDELRQNGIEQISMVTEPAARR